MVEQKRLELSTLTLPVWCSSQLSYCPEKFNFIEEQQNGSGTWIRTKDQVVNSHLLYRWAMPERWYHLIYHLRIKMQAIFWKKFNFFLFFCIFSRFLPCFAEILKNKSALLVFSWFFDGLWQNWVENRIIHNTWLSRNFVVFLTKFRLCSLTSPICDVYLFWSNSRNWPSFDYAEIGDMQFKREKYLKQLIERWN